MKYLLSNSDERSRTWASHLKNICCQYGLEDPEILLRRDPPTKSQFSNNVLTRIRSFHENELRMHEDPGQKLQYLNVSLLGLSGRRHPSLSGIFTVTDVRKSRHHIKMLTGDLFTYEKKSEQLGGSPFCRLCSEDKNESVSHILTSCSVYTELRTRILKEFEQLCEKSKSGVNFSEIMQDNTTLCQFVLDPTSMNLSRRIHMTDELLGAFFRTSRDFCACISEKRTKMLSEIQNRK